MPDRLLALTVYKQDVRIDEVDDEQEDTDPSRCLQDTCPRTIEQADDGRSRHHDGRKGRYCVAGRHRVEQGARKKEKIIYRPKCRC